MKKIYIKILIALLCIFIIPISASGDILGAEERYESALIQLNAYLGSNAEVSLDAVIQEFKDLRGYREAGGFLCYTEVMQLMNDSKADEKLLQGYLKTLDQNDKLVYDIKSQKLKGIDENTGLEEWKKYNLTK